MAEDVSKAPQSRLSAFDEKLAGLSLLGLWRRDRGGEKVEPRLWRWPDILTSLEEAGDVVDLGGLAERRVLTLVSPELKQETSRTLSMFFQYLKPGETAKAHRHTLAALRFVVQGHGTYTTVEGEPMPMESGDLILTPNWTWHDHTNTGDTPTIWIDGLDAGLVTYLEAAFGEPFGEGDEVQPLIKPEGYSRERLGVVRPRTEADMGALPFHYRWSDTEPALEQLAAAGEADPYDGVLLEYTNPVTGGPTFPTMTCCIQMLRPGERTRRHRHTGSTLYHAFRGAGVSRVEDADLSWDERDCFTVPPWQWHQHANRSKTEPAILFSMTDRPVLQALGLFRAEGEPT